MDEAIRPLRWRDYDFETRCLSGLPLTEAQIREMQRQYRRAIARTGRAPRLGDPIFHIS